MHRNCVRFNKEIADIKIRKIFTTLSTSACGVKVCV